MYMGLLLPCESIEIYILSWYIVASDTVCVNVYSSLALSKRGSHHAKIHVRASTSFHTVGHVFREQVEGCTCT